MNEDHDDQFTERLNAYFEKYGAYPRPGAVSVSRNPSRLLRLLEGVALTAALAIGAVFVVTARNAGKAVPAVAVPPGATLDVKEFGFKMALPAGIQDATYRIDSSQNGTNGIVGDVVVTTPAVHKDSACAGSDEIGDIVVSTVELPNAFPGSAPTDRKVGTYWLQPNQAFNGTPCNSAQATGQGLFMQAFDAAFPATPTPASTAIPFATPNPAFPGTDLTLSGARTGSVSVTALRCQNKNQSGDTVVEGTAAGNNMTLQLLNPAVFDKPPFSGAGQQGYVSLYDSGTVPRNQASPSAANWKTLTEAGVTYSATGISIDVDLPAGNTFATGTVHVSGTIACSS